MNFENYVGKRVRVHTNIIDDYTDKYKIVEGVYDGFESIGNSNYIIIDGISYPEMCINNFGLLPEVITKVSTDDVIVLDDFIPAFTLQTDPMDMINDSIDELELVNETKKSILLSLFSGEWISRMGATIFILAIVVMSILASSSAKTNYDIPISTPHTFNTNNNGLDNYLITNNGMYDNTNRLVTFNNNTVIKTLEEV